MLLLLRWLLFNNKIPILLVRTSTWNALRIHFQQLIVTSGSTMMLLFIAQHLQIFISITLITVQVVITDAQPPMHITRIHQYHSKFPSGVCSLLLQYRLPIIRHSVNLLFISTPICVMNFGPLKLYACYPSFCYPSGHYRDLYMVIKKGLMIFCYFWYIQIH